MPAAPKKPAKPSPRVAAAMKRYGVNAKVARLILADIAKFLAGPMT